MHRERPQGKSTVDGKPLRLPALPHGKELAPARMLAVRCVILSVLHAEDGRGAFARPGLRARALTGAAERRGPAAFVRARELTIFCDRETARF